MSRAFLACFIFLALAATQLLADEQIRQVQEELRKRNLYFGDVDGQQSEELAGALKRYQARKGFSVTGAVDEETTKSLHISAELSDFKPPNGASPLPNEPVLKSDVARALPEPERAALERIAEESPDGAPSPVVPAESPTALQNLDPSRVRKFVEDYLRDAQGDNVPSQVAYYGFPIEYFDHGRVNRAFVTKDTRNYVKRWPTRKYVLTAPVSFVASVTEGETVVEFPITFTVKNHQHVATGKTRNYWTIRPEGDDLKIVAIREERVRN